MPAIPVEADSGAIGGKGSQEFIFLSEIGEDSIASAPSAATPPTSNGPSSIAAPPIHQAPLPMELVHTPGTKTIQALAQFLGIGPRQTAKAVFYLADGRPVFVVIRGDLEVNEVKLMNALNARAVRPMTDDEIAAAGWVAGYASPVELRDVLVVADTSIPPAPNLVAGANRPDHHLRNVNYGRDWHAEIVADIGLVASGTLCARCGGAIAVHRGIELGHVFKLGYTYSEKMHVTFLDPAGDQRLPLMGCYGIGVERLLAAVVEANHDEQGIRWPRAVAPYDIHLVAIDFHQADVRAAVEAAERALEETGLTLLTDDRDERPGVKFNDADLLGIPLRLTLSPRNLKEAVGELKRRDQPQAAKAPLADLPAAVRQALEASPQRNAAP